MRELKLGDDHDGIIELPAEAEVGAPAVKALGLEGPVIEIKLTPDRSDCFGVSGIARDLAAAGLGRLRRATSRRCRDGCARAGDPPRLPGGRGEGLPAVRRPDHPRRAQRAQPGLAAQPAEGDRPAADLGPGRHHQLPDLRPLPAAARLRRRQARGRPRPALRPARRGAACAGRPDLPLGRRHDRDRRRDAGRSASAASWAARGQASPRPRPNRARGGAVRSVRTAATGRRLGIESDARTRFERGLDPELVLPATEFATRLILELCGGAAGPGRCRRGVPGAGPGGPLPAPAPAAAGRHRPRAAGDRAPARGPRLRPQRRPRGVAGPAAVLAARRDHRGLHRRGAGAAARLRPDSAGARHPRRRRRHRRADARPAAPGGATARRGRSRLCRGGDLVVHPARACHRRSAPARRS